MTKTYYLKEVLDHFGIEEWNCKGMLLNPVQKSQLTKIGLTPRRWTAFLNYETPMTTDEVVSIGNLLKIPPHVLLLNPEQHLNGTNYAQTQN